MGQFQLYPYNCVILSLYAREVVIKGLKSIIPVKSVVVIHVINPQYIFIIRVVDINYRCYNYKVWNGGSGTLFFFFFHLPLYALFLLNLFLKLG